MNFIYPFIYLYVVLNVVLDFCVKNTVLISVEIDPVLEAVQFNITADFRQV